MTTLEKLADKASASWQCPAGKAYSRIARRMLEDRDTRRSLTVLEQDLLSGAALHTVQFTPALRLNIHNLNHKKSDAVKQAAYNSWNDKVEMKKSLGVKIECGIDFIGPPQKGTIDGNVKLPMMW